MAYLCQTVGRAIANSLGDQDFYPRSSHTKDLKMVLDTFSLYTQHYKVPLKGKVGQYGQKGSALPYTAVS